MYSKVSHLKYSAVFARRSFYGQSKSRLMAWCVKSAQGLQLEIEMSDIFIFEHTLVKSFTTYRQETKSFGQASSIYPKS